MSKKVKVDERCIVASDDKGQRTLVANAKEALTTLSKNNIDVYIRVSDQDKDGVEKFLKDNNVPFKGVVTGADTSEYDATVIPQRGAVLFRGEWRFTIESIASALYDESEKKTLTIQEKMDDSWDEYKKWAQKANKSPHCIG